MEQFNTIHSCKRFKYNERRNLCVKLYFTTLNLFIKCFENNTFFLLPKCVTIVKPSDNVTRLTRRFRTFKSPPPPQEKPLSSFSEFCKLLCYLNLPRAFVWTNCSITKSSIKTILKRSPNSSLFWLKSA